MLQTSSRKERSDKIEKQCEIDMYLPNMKTCVIVCYSYTVGKTRKTKTCVEHMLDSWKKGVRVV